MPVMYNQQHVDEKYVPILEPNLYYGSVFVPNVTCTDKYQIGPAGGIFVHKLSTTAVEVGTPGRDFTDEETKDALIPILLNNNYQKSKKIYGVQAAAVGIALANENMSTAIREVDEGRQLSTLACLVKEGTASANTAVLTAADVKKDIIKTRQEIVTAKGRANIVLCSPSFYSLILEAAGKDFTPSTNDRIVQSGNVGVWLGFTFIEYAGAAATNGKYYDYTGTLQTVPFANLDYVMYYHETLSVVPNFNTARLRDSENFVGSKAQVEVNCGYRVTNPVLARVRKNAGA
ncbi:MAG: hypothetical protein ACK5L3_11485 [Oscillospiraceae bacterium]